MSGTQKVKNDYYRFSHAVQCFQRAKSALGRLESHYDDPELKILFTCAFVIYYAKPFKESGPIVKNLRINRKDAPPDVRFGKEADFAEVFHNKIIVLRDKFYAHTDVDIEDGTGNACFVESSGVDAEENVSVNAFFRSSGISRHEIQIYQDLVRQLIEIFQRKAHDALGSSMAFKELTKKGIYELLQDSESRWFKLREDMPADELPPPPSEVYGNPPD